MKIIIVQDYLRSGGTERQSVLLVNAFAAAGHKVSLITFRPGGPLISTLAKNVAHHALQKYDTHLDWFAPGLTTLIEKFTPDIILCMGRIANCYAHTFVNEAQDRWPKTAVICTMRTGKKLPWLYRHSLRKARHVVANSRAAGKILIDSHGLSPERLTVITNSLLFPPDQVITRNKSLRAEHGADSRTNVLLDVAMLRKEKNQRELIAITAGLPGNFPWQLWLAGDGPELKRCRRLAHEHGVADRVKFFGFTKDPAPLYAAADLAVHASYSESLSNFLIEAQAHGLPAVAYAAQGVDECFLPGDTGAAISFGEQNAFRAAIQNLSIPDPPRSERARTFARTTFDSSRQIQAYLNLFNQLVSP